MIDFLTPCTYMFDFMRIWRITFSSFTGVRLFFPGKRIVDGISKKILIIVHFKFRRLS